MMLMSGISEDMSRNDHIMDKMSEKEVEGMIVFPSENIAAKTIEELQDKGIPFVFVDQILTGIEADQVHADNLLEHGIPLEEALFINTPELKNSNVIYFQVLNLLKGLDRPPIDSAASFA